MKLTAQEFVTNLHTNAWHWGLVDFCQRCGLDYREPGPQQMFLNFQEAVRVLGKLPPRVIAIVATPANAALPTPAEDAAKLLDAITADLGGES